MAAGCPLYQARASAALARFCWPSLLRLSMVAHALTTLPGVADPDLPFHVMSIVACRVYKSKPRPQSRCDFYHE